MSAILLKADIGSAKCNVRFGPKGDYYNAVRTHLSLGKDAPNGRAIQRHGRIKMRPILGDLHHQYVRI
jgi:hypothetical protein